LFRTNVTLHARWDTARCGDVCQAQSTALRQEAGGGLALPDQSGPCQLRQYRRWPSVGPVCTPGAPPCCQRRDACLWPDWLADGGTGTNARVRSSGRGLTPEGKLQATPAPSRVNCDTSSFQHPRVEQSACQLHRFRYATSYRRAASVSMDVQGTTVTSLALIDRPWRRSRSDTW